MRWSDDNSSLLSFFIKNLFLNIIWDIQPKWHRFLINSVNSNLQSIRCIFPKKLSYSIILKKSERISIISYSLFPKSFIWIFSVRFEKNQTTAVNIIFASIISEPNFCNKKWWIYLFNKTYRKICEAIQTLAKIWRATWRLSASFASIVKILFKIPSINYSLAKY